MKHTGPSGVSRTVSIASRVVPGMSCTIERSSPSSRLKSVDFPTLGRPMMATLGVSPEVGVATVGPSPPARSSGSARPGAGSRSTTASSKSPVPRPWIALTERGSPRPSATNSQAESSRFASSTLFTTKRTGRPRRRITLAAARSSSVTPVVTSTTISTTSASASARSTCSLTLASSSSPPASHPPVSITSKGTPAHSAGITLRSRVTPCSSSTTAARVPAMRFTKEDLPTFGRPAITTVGRFMRRRRAGTRRRRGRRAASVRRSGPLRPAAADRPRSARRGTGPR